MTMHWSDSCLGHYQYVERNNTTLFRFIPWENTKELEEGDAVYSPITTPADIECNTCNHHFNEILSLQRHTVVRTKKGKRQGKLLWKHEGYITPKVKHPTVEQLQTAGTRYLYNNNLPFILRHWRGRQGTSILSRDDFVDVSRTAALKMHFSSFCFWHPTQWNEVPARENSVTKALENL